MKCFFCDRHIKGTIFRYKDNSFCSTKCRKKELYNDYLKSKDPAVKDMLYKLFILEY